MRDLNCGMFDDPPVIKRNIKKKGSIITKRKWSSKKNEKNLKKAQYNDHQSLS